MFNGGYVVDNFALVLKALFLLAGYVVILLSTTYVEEGDYYQGEYYFLLLSSVLGMVMMASSRDLVSIFVALELLSIPAYMLAAWRKRDEKSNEAGMKYFLLGVFASAVMLYGMSLFYGVAGTTLLTGVADAVAKSGNVPIISLAVVFIVVGFAFKVSAVPFHTWAPDTYEGAPTPDHRVPVGGVEGGRVRGAPHAPVRRLPVGQGRLPAAVLGAVGADDDRRQRAGAAPDEHRPHAGLLVHQPGRLHPDAARGGGRSQAPGRRAPGRDHLPDRLRGDEPRRLRRRAGGGPQDPLGRDLQLRRPVQLRARPGHGHDDLPGLAGRRAAARRLDRQVRRVHRRPRAGHDGRRGAGRDRGGELGDRLRLLRPRHAGDVDARRARRRCRAHPGAAAAHPGARPDRRDHDRHRRHPPGRPPLRRPRAPSPTPSGGDPRGSSSASARRRARSRSRPSWRPRSTTPTGGFYAAGGRAGGRSGHFLTSPEVGPLFGAVLARALDTWWDGRGPAVALRGGRRRGRIRARWPARCWRPGRPWPSRAPSATSPSSGRRRSGRPTPAWPWPPSRQLPDEPFAGVVLANELLDNLPFRLAVHDGGWREAFVDVDGGGRPSRCWRPFSAVPACLPSTAAARRPSARAGCRRRRWVADAVARLRPPGGSWCSTTRRRRRTMAARPWREWLRTYRDHQRGGHYLADPGAQDITSDVALDQLPPPTTTVDPGRLPAGATAWRRSSRRGGGRGPRTRRRPTWPR